MRLVTGVRVHFSRLLLALALLALGVRVAAPPGYMLAPDAQGALTVALCGGGEAHIPLGDPAHHSGKGTSDGHCLYAAAPTPAPAGEAASIAAPMRAFLAFAPSRAPARIGQGLAAPPPPSTGPPLFS